MYRQSPNCEEFLEIEHLESSFLPESTVASRNPEDWLVVGFDTEYQKRLANGVVENEVLSYQYSCLVIKRGQSDAVNEWSGLVLPNSSDVKDRLSIVEFISCAVSEGIKKYKDIAIPRQIYLVAHFTRADVPSFREYKSDSLSRGLLGLDNIRGTFNNVSKDISVSLKDTETGSLIKLKVKIRDTIHLAPAGAKSLQDLGEILGFEKIVLGDSVKESKSIKANMKSLLESDWDLFKAYAIRDAEICSLYAKDMILQSESMLGKFSLPVTLSSIGVDLLQKYWKETGVDPLNIVGLEKVSYTRWDKKLGHDRKYTKTVAIKKLFWSLDFLTECYHGGRNEQFVFGPADVGVWYDYDLQSAYPSAMSLIGIPDWESIRPIKDLQELISYKPVDLAFANVNFKFPESVKYPCLPVRTDAVVLFPRTGNCSTHISEILLAISMGCEIEFIEGRFINSDRDGKNDRGFRNRVFEGFLVHCLEERNKYEKKSMKNLFWKEVANSTYGKTAQGLRERRIYDLRQDDMRSLDPSKITNPVYAAFITAFCRGTLSEIMNNLPKRRTVFSVTTDGFLTDATEKDIVDSTRGVLCRYYKSARHKLTTDETIYEVKHVVNRPLGWRTRGQATLIPAESDQFPDLKPDQLIVLAKGGVSTPDLYTKEEQNDSMVKRFFERTPNCSYSVNIGLGIKDMYSDGADFIDNTMIKKLSMEFDWKRKPSSLRTVSVEFDGSSYSHIAFDTLSWDSVDHFNKIRLLWKEYTNKSPKVLKTEEDYRDFSSYVSSKLSVDSIAQKYLKKRDGDLIRLRRDLITAWRHRVGGTHKFKPHCFGYTQVFPTYKMSASLFAQILNDHLLIPCSKGDVDNGVKIKIFTPHQVPNTQAVRLKLVKIKHDLFPEIDMNLFLSKSADWDIEL